MRRLTSRRQLPGELPPLQTWVATRHGELGQVIAHEDGHARLQFKGAVQGLYAPDEMTWTEQVPAPESKWVTAGEEFHFAASDYPELEEILNKPRPQVVTEGNEWGRTASKTAEQVTEEDDGHNDGYHDGYAGRPPNMERQVWSYDDTGMVDYARGYHEGYSEGANERANDSGLFASKTAGAAGWYVIQRGTGVTSGGPYAEKNEAEVEAWHLNTMYGTNEYLATELGSTEASKTAADDDEDSTDKTPDELYAERSRKKFEDGFRPAFPEEEAKYGPKKTSKTAGKTATRHLTLTGPYAGQPICGAAPQPGDNNVHAAYAPEEMLTSPDTCAACRAAWATGDPDADPTTAPDSNQQSLFATRKVATEMTDKVFGKDGYPPSEGDEIVMSDGHVWRVTHVNDHTVGLASDDGWTTSLQRPWFDRNRVPLPGAPQDQHDIYKRINSGD